MPKSNPKFKQDQSHELTFWKVNHLRQTKGLEPLRIEHFRELWQKDLALAKPKTASRLMVAIAIGWHMNKETGLAWPGTETIASWACVGVRTVQRASAWWESKGLLGITRRRKDRGRHWSNRYYGILKSQGVKAVTVQGVKAVTPEPLREPNLRMAMVSTVGERKIKENEKKEGIRESEKAHQGPHHVESPLSSDNQWAACFRLARKHFKKRGAGVVSSARDSGCDVLAVMDALRETVDLGGTVDDFAHRLWELSR